MKTIKILGSGCANCKKLEAVAREAATSAGIEAEFVKVTDMKAMLAYDLLSTPGLVIDDKLVSSGRIPTQADVPDAVADVIENLAIAHIGDQRAQGGHARKRVAADFRAPAAVIGVTGFAFFGVQITARRYRRRIGTNAQRADHRLGGYRNTVTQEIGRDLGLKTGRLISRHGQAGENRPIVARNAQDQNQQQTTDDKCAATGGPPFRFRHGIVPF